MKKLTTQIKSRLILASAAIALTSITSSCGEQKQLTNDLTANITTKDTQETQAELEFTNMWYWNESAGRASVVMLEFKNTTNKPIKAFKVDMVSVDDFDEESDFGSIKFDSKCSYCKADGSVDSGVNIAPGEVIRWCEWQFKQIKKTDFGGAEYNGGGNTYLTTEMFNPIIPQTKLDAQRRARVKIQSIKVVYSE